MRNKRLLVMQNTLKQRGGHSEGSLFVCCRDGMSQLDLLQGDSFIICALGTTISDCSNNNNPVYSCKATPTACTEVSASCPWLWLLFYPCQKGGLVLHNCSPLHAENDPLLPYLVRFFVRFFFSVSRVLTLAYVMQLIRKTRRAAGRTWC